MAYPVIVKSVLCLLRQQLDKRSWQVRCERASGGYNILLISKHNDLLLQPVGCVTTLTIEGVQLKLPGELQLHLAHPESLERLTEWLSTLSPDPPDHEQARQMRVLQRAYQAVPKLKFELELARTMLLDAQDDYYELADKCLNYYGIDILNERRYNRDGWTKLGG